MRLLNPDKVSFTFPGDNVMAAHQSDVRGPSLTNCAEEVLTLALEYCSEVGDTRLIYRDSEGVWDEIVHIDGKFVGFHLLRAQTVGEAVAMIEEERARERRRSHD